MTATAECLCKPARLPFEIVKRWRRWKARENELTAMQRELDRNPHRTSLQAQIDRMKQTRARHKTPDGWTSWEDLEARLRATGQW